MDHRAPPSVNPVKHSRAEVVKSYVRERFPRLAARWIGIFAFLTAVHGAFRLREWGVSLESIGMIGAAFAMAATGAVIAVALSLVVGGMLHAHGVELPEWLTRRRGE